MGVEPFEALTAANLVDAGQTVAPGGIITVSSSPISITAGAALAVVGSITQSLVNAAVTQKALLTFAGPTCTAGDCTDFAIAGQTLTKGGVIKVGGTQSSLGQTGTDVVIGSGIWQVFYWILQKSFWRGMIGRISARSLSFDCIDKLRGGVSS